MNLRLCRRVQQVAQRLPQAREFVRLDAVALHGNRHHALVRPVEPLDRHQRESRRQLAAADAEVAALKTRLAKLEEELAELKKAAAASKPAPDKK